MSILFYELLAYPLQFLVDFVQLRLHI